MMWFCGRISKYFCLISKFKALYFEFALSIFMHLFIDKPFPCMKSKRNRQWAIIDLELQRNDIRLNIFEYMFTYCLFEGLQNIMFTS